MPWGRGSPVDPDWYLNCVRYSEAITQIGEQLMTVVATVVTGEDRARLWKDATRMYPGYDEYARKTSRVIPVVALEPNAA